MNDEIRVLIVDDHPLMRQGVHQSIESTPGLKVVGEAGDGRSALELVESLKPDVVVLDISMPVVDGFGMAREMKLRGIPAELVFLTAQSDESLLDEALALGAKGYILKECAASDVAAAVRAAVAGKHYISPTLAAHLLRGKEQSRRPQPPPGSLKDLTAAEMRVLRLVAEYKTTREIAAELFVSPLTVETHRRNMCEKLGLRGSNALVRFSLANKELIS
jgi:DNA-binding NarL/FixJ family response regulator